MIHIIDSYNEILNRFQTGFTLERWRGYAAAIHPQLVQKSLSDSCAYDFEKEVLPIIKTALNSAGKLETLHQSFLSATDGLNEKTRRVLGSSLEADIILYLGLCNGAGWATSLGGRNAVLLGAEKILELGWFDTRNMTALIYHELGHIWHKTVGNLYPAAETISGNSLRQLYQEGVAMYCEQLLAGDFDFYHQDRDGWLKWCVGNRSELLTEFSRRVSGNVSVQDFFGDWQNYRGYSDTGYFLGCEFIKFLVDRLPLEQVANLNITAITAEFSGFQQTFRQTKKPAEASFFVRYYFILFKPF